jgi:hypothetical protein
MYVCKAGHRAIRKARIGKKGVAVNQKQTYYFDIEKCNIPHLKKDVIQAKFQESEYFKEKSKERYKIEAKNSELKHRHGYDVASSSGLIGMELQGAMAIVNLKRILGLKTGNIAIAIDKKDDSIIQKMNLSRLF